MNPVPKHLLSLSDLTPEQIKQLLAGAQLLIDKGLHRVAKSQVFADYTVANLFYESSTRTRVSFELAAKRLGMTVVNLAIESSAMQKGETIFDTVQTLYAMNCTHFVIRHRDDNCSVQLAATVPNGVKIINAGDGKRAHPTQGLLDMLTIYQSKRDFSQLTVAIIGDIQHSRVARSDLAALKALGVKQIRLIGPAAFLPDSFIAPGVSLHYDMESALTDVDVIISLRVQKERMASSEVPNQVAFHDCYGLTPKRLALAKPDAIVLHPGPMNIGMEITEAVATSPQSRILKQVENGVAMRMAVFAWLNDFPFADIV